MTQTRAFLTFMSLVLALLLLGGKPPASAQEATATPAAPEASPTSLAIPGAPALAVLSVQPSSVMNTAATELIVTGSGFVDGAVVVAGSAGALPTTFVSGSLLRATLPAGTNPGTYAISVVNPDALTVTLLGALSVSAPAGPTSTPGATATPYPTPFLRPVLVVNSYGASSAQIAPGQDLDFEMTLGNAGQGAATNVMVTFTTGSFIPRATGGIRALGNIDPGQSARFWQPLSASRDLSGQRVGTMDVKVSYTDVAGNPYSETFTLSFPLVPPAVGAAATATPTPTATPTATPSPTAGPRLRPQLIVTGYDTDVAQLEPGVTFQLRLSIQNKGNADARRVSLILGGGTASGGSLAGTPESGGVNGGGGEFSRFAPVGSSNVQFLGDLNLGDFLEATQRLIVNAETKPGAYPIKVSFVYNDGQNVSYVDDQVITLLVRRRPSATMNFYAPPPLLFAGQPGGLPLQLLNAGRDTTVFGDFSVTATGATLENSSVFVGALEPGGSFPLDAVIYPEQPGTLELLLTVGYIDDFNQAQTLTRTVSIDVMEAPIFEEPPPVDGPPPEESAPETWQDRVWRFVLGLVGLSSGPRTPGQGNAGGGDLGPGGPGITEPGLIGQ